MGGPSPRPCVWATQLRSPKKHRSGGDTVSALTGPGNKPQTPIVMSLPLSKLAGMLLIKLSKNMMCINKRYGIVNAIIIHWA